MPDIDVVWICPAGVCPCPVVVPAWALIGGIGGHVNIARLIGRVRRMMMVTVTNGIGTTHVLFIVETIDTCAEHFILQQRLIGQNVFCSIGSDAGATARRRIGTRIGRGCGIARGLLGRSSVLCAFVLDRWKKARMAERDCAVGSTGHCVWWERATTSAKRTVMKTGKNILTWIWSDDVRNQAPFTIGPVRWTTSDFSSVDHSYTYTYTRVICIERLNKDLYLHSIAARIQSKSPDHLFLHR